MTTRKFKRGELMFFWQAMNVFKRLDMPSYFRVALERNSIAVEPEVNSILKVYPNPPDSANGEFAEYMKLMEEEVEVSVREVNLPEWKSADLRKFWPDDEEIVLNEHAQRLTRGILPMIKDA